ncbi:unnamed protein product [Cercospora beticola]|nr:unnamed protein product [Cercospora beticola]
MTEPSLLGLPCELRRSVLQLLLKQRGTIELQYPVWAGLGVFSQPLFQTCHRLREEAIDVFYETNDFLWIIDLENHSRSDPAKYPVSTTVVNDRRPAKPHMTSTLTPVLPWEFSGLMSRLRHLHVNLCLPQEQNPGKLRFQLGAVVKALDRGRRLLDFHLLVTTKRGAARAPLSVGEISAIEALAEMEIRGTVQVRTRKSFQVVWAPVIGMNLLERMKARP